MKETIKTKKERENLKGKSPQKNIIDLKKEKDEIKKSKYPYSSLEGKRGLKKRKTMEYKEEDIDNYLDKEKNKVNDNKKIKEKEKLKINFQEKTIKAITNKSVNALKEGRIKKVASYSQGGEGENGSFKPNQDSFLVLENLYNFKDFNIFSVFDGHGKSGHLISNFVNKYFASFFHNNTMFNSNKNEDEIYCLLKKNNSDIIKNAFQQAQTELDDNTKIDSNFSGTTCVMVIQIGEKILCANVGDCRAILVKELYKVNRIIPLSIDNKPEHPEETKRINESGGEVSQLEEDGIKSGPYRVWKKGEAYPGLAMSRSIGDYIATSIGVIPIPKIIEETIDNNTKFIIVASDGVWEFLDNQKVVDIVMPFYKVNDPDGACKAVIKESTQLWKQEDIIIDDITIIIIFF